MEGLVEGGGEVGEGSLKGGPSVLTSQLEDLINVRRLKCSASWVSLVEVSNSPVL